MATSLVLVAMLSAAAVAEPTTIALKPDGTGDFPSLQAAIDATADGSIERVTIRLAPGTYSERLRVERAKPPIAIVGTGQRPEQTVLSFNLNASVIVPPATQPVGTTGSASLTVFAAGFSMENLTVENTAGDTGQAVAFKTTGDRGLYRNVRFLGWQDTLYVDAGRHLFDRCHVEGRTDFIFGGATAVFDRCTIRSKNGGWVTAARTPADQKFGYVFLDCQFVGEGAPAYLGRPWQWDRGRVATVALIRCTIGPHVRPEGWHPWSDKNTEPAKTTRYAEFGSVAPDGTPIDVSARVPWAGQLTADEAATYTIANVLSGADRWSTE